MRNRGDVLREFGEQPMTIDEGYIAADTYKMADEIVRLREALAAPSAAAGREVTEAMVEAGARAWFADPMVTFDSCSDYVQNWHREQARIALTAALVAERGREG